MYLLEHDAKQLLANHGIPSPQGCLLSASSQEADLPPGPWVVKGQITAGGRGKAGLIQKAATVADVHSKTAEILGKQVKGRTVRAVGVEPCLSGCHIHPLDVVVVSRDFAA